MLFLGNMDNVNLRLCRWARRLGADAEIYLLDKESARGEIHLIDPSYAEHRPEWMHDDLPVNLWDRHQYSNLLAFAEDAGVRGRQWERSFDCMVASGPSGILASRSVSLPKVFAPVGGELTEFPFLMKMWGRCGRSAFRLTRLVKSAIRRIDVIFDSSLMSVRAARRLGVADKMMLTGFPEDVVENRRQVKQELLSELGRRYRDARYVFLWLSRLNFTDPKDPHYKGVERYLQALERYQAHIERGEIRLVFGRHGEDSEKFIELLGTTPLAPHVDWVGHLDYPDLLTYLSLPNAVLFSEFGDRELVISGVTRDAMSVGTLTVSSAEAEYNRQLYGESPPTLYARTSEEIDARIHDILAFSGVQFDEARRRTLSFGESCMNYRRYLESMQKALVPLIEVTSESE